MLHLYTENFFWPARAKNLAKKFLGKDMRGPKAVERSLTAGLTEIGVQFYLNYRIKKPVEVACVLSGVKTLRWAIERKKLGLVKKLIAGPNIEMPENGHSIIFDENIDKLIVPAGWVRNFLMSLKPGFKDKIVVWAAGVKTESLQASKNVKTDCLVFKKNIQTPIFKQILSELDSENISYCVVEYSNYNHGEYLGLLSKVKFAVFLSNSESQNLALHEAWMMGVPTLVWNGGKMYYKKLVWEDEKISAPYLDPQAGTFFKDVNDFKKKLNGFLSQLSHFTPRQYHLQNFTNQIAAKKFLEIV